MAFILLLAALGGNAASVEADRVQMQAALLRIQNQQAFTLHEIQSATGTTIREYVSPSGDVFAVAWSGPFQPDLRQVLGSYFDSFQRLARTRRGHGPLTLTDGDFVIQVTGHMRSFVGRAYVTGMMPAGVDARAIQ